VGKPFEHFVGADRLVRTRDFLEYVAPQRRQAKSLPLECGFRALDRAGETGFVIVVGRGEPRMHLLT
jgi:hypothetical protein